MPIPGGTAGSHDDSSHQGSAKRDVVDGVAGLDALGNILAVGKRLYLTRDATHDVFINERTSGDVICWFDRLGSNDYQMSMKSAVAYSVVQLANMKDIADGIASLGAGGQLLAPGSDIELTRDGSENIEVVERTSGDIVYRWTRIGANDYECRINCGGVACKILNDSLINAVSGIAGLDANALLTPALLPPCLEEYSNHLGAADNFTTTATAGNGAAAADAANHEMDLDSGNGVAGYALFRSKKQWTLGTEPIVSNMILNNISQGAGGISRQAYAGLKGDFADQTIARRYNHAGFELDEGGQWRAITSDTVGVTSTNVTIANGDLFTVMATSAKVLFFVNGTLVATHTANIPTAALNLGAAVHTWDGIGSASVIFSVDLMGIKVFL